MHGVRGPTSCVGRKVISPRLRGRGGGDLAGVGARVACVRVGFPGTREASVVSIVQTAGGRAPAHHARGRGRRTWRPTERTAGARMVPPGAGNDARGDGRRGVGVSQSTAEAGELSPRDPVEGRGHRQVAPVEGKTANTPRVGPVSTSRHRDSRTGQTRLRDGGGHRLASWTRGYATARSEAVCRGAGCGRTRTSGSVGGQGQQRPWSTRPTRATRRAEARVPPRGRG